MGLAIVGYPAAAASLGMLVARLANPESRARQAALVATATAGLVTSYLALAGMPKLPPIDSIGWVPIITLCAGVLGIVASFASPSDRARQRATVLGLALAAAVAVYLTGEPTFAGSAARFLPLGVGAIAMSIIALTNSSNVARRGFAVGGWLALLVTAVLSALCALWGSSASLATLLGSMATTAGVVGIGGLVLRMNEPAPAAQGVVIAHMTATVTYAHLYANLPTVPLLLLAASVAMPALSGLVPGEGNRMRWVRGAIAVALAAGFAGAAALIMHSRFAVTVAW